MTEYGIQMGDDPDAHPKESKLTLFTLAKQVADLERRVAKMEHGDFPVTGMRKIVSFTKRVAGQGG